MDNPRYIIDGNRIQTWEEMAQAINAFFTDAGWSGLNLDALDDRLFGGFGTPDQGFRVDWLRSDLSRERLGYAETVRWIEAKMQEYGSNASLEQKREQARQRKGLTLFEEILLSFRHNQHITLNLE